MADGFAKKGDGEIDELARLAGPVFVAGDKGMVGSAIVRRMAGRKGPVPLTVSRAELDLRDGPGVEMFLRQHRPAAVIVAAARVGGIEANRIRPADFIADNLSIALNLIEGAHRAGIQRLLFLGSSCIYPRLATQPIAETALLEGPLEPTNEAYAVAKIAGLKLCQYFRQQHGRCYHALMPTNLYGPGDNYNPGGSHVLPALIRKFHEAREQQADHVTLWGSGKPLREFLHVDDLADACLHVLALPDPPDWLNVGSGEEISIRGLAELIREAFGLTCRLAFDPSMPDGTPRKLLDCRKIRNLGWTPNIPLSEGVKRTVADYLDELASGKLRGIAQKER